MSEITLFQKDSAFVPSRILARLPFISGVKIDLDARQSEHRKIVESYIHDKFSKRYAANINNFLPHLLSIRCNDNICAALGIRTAESEPLYLEKFIRNPIEQEIGIRFRMAIARENIIEISNFVSSWRSGGQLLFILLTDFLSRHQREWFVFIATREVEHLLNKMKFTLIHMADIPEKLLDDEKDHWGSYFNDKPKIIFGHIPGAMSVLKQNTLTKFSLSILSDQLTTLADQWDLVSEQ